MSIKELLSGYILQPSRNASSNSKQTSSAINGVLRDVSEIPLQHISLFGETLASQYRSAYLEQPYGVEEEYLIWASNNSNLSLIENSDWEIGNSDLFFGNANSSFENELGNSYTSTDQVFIQDTNSKSIAGVTALYVRRGDYSDIGEQPIPKELLVGVHFSYEFGVITLNPVGKALLGGGLSETRGDDLTAASYYLEKSKFWWSKNDPQTTRFAWNDKEGAWTPLKGQSVINVGKLLPNESYKLAPKVLNVGLGEFLKGDPANPMEKALIRIGTNASESSAPVRVKVIEDILVSDEYDFAGDPDQPEAILGIEENKLVFDPAFILSNAGNIIWYSFEYFTGKSNGIVGRLSDNPLYLCPVPSIFERPMIKIGNRKHLIAMPVETEADLDALVLSNEKTFGWATTTGKIKFHNDLIEKANEESPNFDLNYIDADVVYDGVCLSTYPIETAQPVALTRVGDDFNIPYAVQQGLRISGILRIPDGTGTTPDNTTPVTERPSEGLQKSLGSIGDFFFFCKSKVLRDVVIENREEDIPFGFFRKKGTAYVALDTMKVFVSNRDLKDIGSDDLYFIQADLTPAKTLTSCRLPSRRKDTYSVRIGDRFVFALKDNTGSLDVFEWVCPTSGTYKPNEMADLLNLQTGLLASGSGRFSVINDYLCIESTSLLGRIEIGYGITSGTYADRDLSGCGSLGFNAGWVVDTSENISYVSDSGFSFGLYRSPKDKSRENGLSDFKQIRQLDTSIGDPASFYFQNLDKVPLEDEIGFEPNVFFRLLQGLSVAPLRNFREIVHNFPQDNFIWVAYNTLQATQIFTERNTFPLIAPIIPKGFLTQLGTGIYLSENGLGFQTLKKEEDFLVGDGQQGILELIDVQNEILSEGARGTCSGTNFQDPSEYSNIQVGHRLKILSGVNKGSYFVTQVNQTNPLNFEVNPSFVDNSSNDSWILYEGIEENTYDPSLICDKVFVPTSHLKEETFKVRVITVLGEAGGTGDTFDFEGGELLQKGRKFYAQVGENTYPITSLEYEELGEAKNNQVFINIDNHLQEKALSLRVGVQDYSESIGNLSFVSVFSDPLPLDVVEVGEYGSAIEGQVQFGVETLAQYGGQQVLYLQDFRDTAFFQATESRLYSPVGVVGRVELVEEYVTNEDLTLAPITGSVSFNEVLKKNKQVEVEYYLANTDGTQQKDVGGLPIRVQTRLTVSYKLQETTRIDETTYAFNAEGRTIDREATLRIWVGARLMNLKGIDATIDYENNLINFVKPLSDSSVNVRVNYFAYESSGAGRSYKTPSFPIWRPPFKLGKDINSFTASGDRVSEFTQGKLLFVDGACFYISGATHNSGFTEVSFSPTTTEEHGSNAPASEQPMFLTDKDLNENTGFWYSADHIGFENVDKGMNKITLIGNHSSALTVNHVFELSGDPYLVESIEVSEDGEYTIVSMQAPFVTAYERSEDTLRISTRPIYFEGGVDFLAKPFVETQDYELVLAGSVRNGIEQPARTLLEEVDYKITPDTGVISFNPMFLKGIKGGERLYFYAVVRRNVSPKMENKNLIVPVITGRYLSAKIPDPEGTVMARFKHYAPDNFYTRVVPNSTYMGEVAQEFSNSLSSAHSGSDSIFNFSTSNHEKGSLDNRGELQKALREDQAARLFIDLYNQIIRGMEQVRETIVGGFVGDRDGKFKFFIGRDEDYTPAGYEDPFSGIYNPRNTWNIYFNRVRRSALLSRIPLLEEDSIIDPLSASLVDNVLEGDFTDLNELNEFILEQKRYIRNDIDDRVLVGRSRMRLFPLRSIGEYRNMGEAHPLSRLYPERTTAFSTLFSGTLSEIYGEGGVYTAGRENNEKVYRTKGSQIGAVENPALGQIKNISSLDVFKRLPRFRVVDFGAEGFPDIDSALGTAIGTKPALIATPLLLKDFPTDSEGIPDTTRLIVNGGDLIDLSTGDYSLSTPPFKRGDQVQFGRPDGTIQFVTTSDEKGVFIDEVIEGCIFTFMKIDESPITSIEDMLSPFTEEPLVIVSGDTISGSVPTNISSGGSEITEVTDFEQQVTVMRATDVYSWNDLGRNQKTGELFDKTRSTEEDGAFFDLQKYTLQDPPKPLQNIEAIVEFSNTRVKPAQLPALKGEEKDDTGDYAIPYLRGGETELSILGDVAKEFEKLLANDNFDVSSSIYPNERMDGNGSMSIRGLETITELTPIASSGGYTPRTGLGDTKEGDFVLVETDPTDPKAWRGIHSVGRFEDGFVQFPRLMTATSSGNHIRYQLNGAAVHVATATDGLGNSLNGLVILDDGVDTTFSISSISGYQLSGWLNFLDTPLDSATGGNRNAIKIEIIEHTTGAVVEVIHIYHVLNPTVSWDRFLYSNNLGLPSPVINMSIDASEETITFAGLTGWFDFASLGLPLGGDPNKFFDFSISILANEDPFTNTTEYNGDLVSHYPNRCQFMGEFDFRKARERGFTHPNGGGSLSTSLETRTIEILGNDLDINNIANVNSSVPFSFTPELIEQHKLSLPNEGIGDIELTGEDIRFAVLAGSTKDETSAICQGTGFCYDDLLAIVGDYSSFVSGSTLDTTVANGTIGGVKKGDVVYIKHSIDSTTGDTYGAIKAGTYLVRQAIEPDIGQWFQDKSASFNAGYTGKKGLGVRFPKVRNISSGTVTVRQAYSIPSSPTGNGFASNGYLYIMTTPAPTLSDTVRVQYVYQTQLDDTITFSITNIDYADGSAFNDPLSSLVGNKCSGMSYLPTVWEFSNLVGYIDTSAPSPQIAGFDTIEISGTSYDVTTGNLVSGSPAVNEIGIHIEPKISSENYDADPDAVIYDNVCTYIDISQVIWSTGLDWLDVTDTFSIVFHALGGIFLEPSIPLQALDLAGTTEKVVDLTHSLSDIGMRSVAGLIPLQTHEEIIFEVSRIRRWNGSTESIDDTIKRLPYVYETRRGVILPSTIKDTVITEGTQLGGFTEELVNVQSGDLLRIIASTGEVIEEVVVEEVLSDTRLAIAPPYIRSTLVLATPEDYTFEIYLRTPMIPLEQSHQELKDMLVDEVLVQGTAGKVTTRNFLEDDSQTFSGVQEDDILIIDPQGELLLSDEKGTRPFGDKGTPNRSEHITGRPSELDDNRGFYRVIEVIDGNVQVSPLHDYAGTGASPITFGNPATFQDFAVLPIVTPVGEDGEFEGQNDLRPTQEADSSDSYKGNYYSIEPFSYTIIRPTGLFSKKMQDYTLFHRERILSWIEEIREPTRKPKTGFYHDFQREEHIAELNDPTDTDRGLGVISNEIIFSMSGETLVTPFINTSDCCSVLDRRNWCQDTRLDYLTPFGSTDPYTSIERLLVGYTTSSGRPLQIDRIDEILDYSDQLRSLRYTWIDFRTNLSNGTLRKARFAQDLLERSLSEQDVLTVIEESMRKL